MKRFLLLVAALSMPAAAADVVVKVGVVEGLSGPPAIVDFGESYLQGLKLALKDYEARGGKPKIELVVYDDEANPQRAVSLVQRLTQSDNVSVVIGTVSSGNVMAFAPILQRAEIPLIAGPSVATNITSDFIAQKPSYIFRCSMVDKFQIDNMLDWGVKTFKKVGLIHSTTGYGSFAAKYIGEGMKTRGSALVAVEAVAPGVNDLTPQMLKMRDAGAELVLNFHESFELPYKPMAALSYHPVIAGNWGLSSLKVEAVVGSKNLEGTVMGQALDLGAPTAKAFDARARKEYDKAYRWPVVVALGYDAGQVLTTAVAKAQSADPKVLRDAIENVDGIKAVTATPSHPFSATDHECLKQKDVFLGVWKDGQVVR
ncbi:MAG TPA: ABC transporter substrate-binding protein, partial [Myxococcales bacterium]|nr:ABC transporter substrate-binding protein [Myxococcales bacterium]